VSSLKPLAKNERVQFKIANLKTPRYQGQVSTPFEVWTVTADEVVDFGSKQVFIEEALTMSQCSMTSSSLVNSSPTALTFTVSQPPDRLQLLSSDQVELTLSPDLSSLPADKITCSVNGKPVPCTASDDGHHVYLSPLEARMFSNGASTARISLEGLKTPSSTKPADGFALSFIDSEARVIYHCAEDLILQTSEAAPIT